MVELNIKSPELVFHSLRHTVVTQLMQAGVQEQLVKAIVGHARDGVTQEVYFAAGYTPAQLRDGIQKLEYSSR